MNTQDVGTLTHNSFDCRHFSTTVFVSGPINHEGYFRFYPRSIGGFNSLYGYYFVLDTTRDFIPSSL